MVSRNHVSSGAPQVLLGAACAAMVVVSGPARGAYRDADVASAPPAASDLHYRAIAHRLRVVTEPLVRATPTGRLRMSEAGPEADSLVALMFANDRFASFVRLADPHRHPYESHLLTSPDTCRIHGRFDFEHHFMSIEIHYVDVTGFDAIDLTHNVGAGIISRENTNLH